MKTDIEIKDDVYAALKNSTLVDAVSGKLCTRLRPKDSKLEDIVISVADNEFNELQEAFVYVNIYVQNQTVDRQSEEHTKRLRELCRIAYESLKLLRINDARITLDRQRVLEVTATKEHVISNRLLYQYANN